MKVICGVNVPESINDVLSNKAWSEAYYNWSAENSNDFINCPYRAERCYEAAANGCDGSTHAEHIDDFREYGDSLFFDLTRAVENAIDGNEMWDTMSEEAAVDLVNSYWEEFEKCECAYEADCDALEDWHDKNGSLNQQVG